VRAAPRFSRQATPDTWVPLSDAALLAFATIISGGSTYYEPCLEPDVERDCLDAFNRLSSRLEAMTRRPAFSREISQEYHRALWGRR
jgi:hypothetical protein